MYSSILSLISAQDGLGGQRHAAATLPSGKTWYPLSRRLCAPQGRSVRVQKISPHRDRLAEMISCFYISETYSLMRADLLQLKYVAI